MIAAAGFGRLRRGAAVLVCGLLTACVQAATPGAAAGASPPLAAPPAAFPATQPAGATACRLGAFVQETDPAGLNVRESPSLNARVLGRLPPMVKGQDLPDYLVRVEVDVVAGVDAWVRVQGARDNTALTGRPARPMHAGSGWVAARKLTVKSQAPTGHARPDARSPVTVGLNDGGGFDGDAWLAASQLVTCQGDWALVEVNERAMSADVRSGFRVGALARQGVPAGRFRVWLNQVCGNQETSCDGLAPPPPPAAPR